MKFKLTEKQALLGDVHTFVWEPSEPVSWQAGQYIHYTLPHQNPDDRGIERWFTISSAPYEGRPQITTRINTERSSSFKTALMAMEVGDEIEADAPEGDFVFDQPDAQHVFIAGGIGVTPYHSILLQLAHEDKLKNITLLYANRNDQITFKDQLDQLSGENFEIKYVINPEKIDAELIKSLPEWQNKIYYVSGPEPMVADLDKMLAELGIPESQIKNDDFPNYTWP